MRKIEGRPGWIKVGLKFDPTKTVNMLPEQFDPDRYFHLDPVAEEPSKVPDELVDVAGASRESKSFKPSAKSGALCDSLDLDVAEMTRLFESTGQKPTQGNFQDFVQDFYESQNAEVEGEDDEEEIPEDVGDEDPLD